MVRKAGMAMAVAALALAGCRDVGLPDKNLPLSVAIDRPWRYQVYDAGAEGTDQMVTLGRERWISTARFQEIPQSMLRAVQVSGGADVYAMSWDAAPYTRLYEAGDVPGRWRVLAPLF